MTISKIIDSGNARFICKWCGKPSNAKAYEFKEDAGLFWLYHLACIRTLKKWNKSALKESKRK